LNAIELEGSRLLAYDLLIKNGTVIDGTGAFRRRRSRNSPSDVSGGYDLEVEDFTFGG
jgi:hypothetical protein